MNIRLATLDDIEILIKMYQDFCAYLKSTLETEKICKIPEYIINSGNRDLIVAEIDGNIAGFIHVAENEFPLVLAGRLVRRKILPPKYAAWVDLYVLSPYRKMKIDGGLIDKNLINAAKDWAMESNLEYVESKILQKINKRMRRKNKKYLKAERTE